MRIPIIAPDLRCGDEPIRVSGWLVDQGDLILAGDFVVELMIPAITIDVQSELSGRVVEIEKPTDSHVRAGDILGWLEDGNDDDHGMNEEEEGQVFPQRS